MHASQVSKLLLTAATAGLALGFFAQFGGCLYKDYCIKVQNLGQNNCRYLQNAQMWPVGQPELAEPVPGSLGAEGPAGCVCFNSAEQDVINFGVPLGHWNALRDEMEAAARNACSSLATPGWDNNCHIDTGTNASTPSITNFFNGYGDCIGSCGYISPPPGGSCPSPNPYECNGEPGGGETGGPDEGGEGGEGGDESAGLNAGEHIQCHGTKCTVDAAFAQSLYDDPTLLLGEGTTLVYDPTTGRFVFEGVSLGSLAAELGFRTGDMLESVGGTTIQDFDSAVRAMVENANATSLGVRILRGTAWVDFSFNFI